MRTALAKMSIFRLSVMLQRYSILPSNVGDTVDVALYSTVILGRTVYSGRVHAQKKKRRPASSDAFLKHVYVYSTTMLAVMLLPMRTACVSYCKDQFRVAKAQLDSLLSYMF